MQTSGAPRHVVGSRDQAPAGNHGDEERDGGAGLQGSGGGRRALVGRVGRDAGRRPRVEVGVVGAAASSTGAKQHQ